MDWLNGWYSNPNDKRILVYSLDYTPALKFSRRSDMLLLFLRFFYGRVADVQADERIK